MPFVSYNFTGLNVFDMTIAFALMDMVSNQSTSDDYSNNFESQGRGLKITLGTSSILYKKEIKEIECEVQSKITISHRYQVVRTSVRDDVDEDEPAVFSKNQPYECMIIITNLTSKRQSCNMIF